MIVNCSLLLLCQTRPTMQPPRSPWWDNPRVCTLNGTPYCIPSSQQFTQRHHWNISEESGYLIKYQKCLHANLLETRYFLPHPTEQKFIEIEKNLMEKGRNQWRDSMRLLKLLCDIHQGPVYTCHIVQRDQSATDPITRGRPAVEKMDLKDILFEWRLQ